MNNLPVRWLVTLLFALPLALFAQQKEEERPEPPFVAAVPPYATWTAALQEPRGGDKEEGKRPRHVRELRVLKIDKARQETRTWSDGGVTQTWITDGFRLFQQPGLPESDIVILSGAEGAPVADFPELAWLNADNFVRVETVRQRRYFYFEEQAKEEQLPKNLPEYATPPARVVQRAWIDVKTRFPYVADLGEGVFVYTFRPSNIRTVSLPDAFAQALSRYKARLAGPERHRMKP